MCFAKGTLGNLHIVCDSLILFLFIDLFAHKLFSLFPTNWLSLHLVVRFFIEKAKSEILFIILSLHFRNFIYIIAVNLKGKLLSKINIK